MDFEIRDVPLAPTISARATCARADIGPTLGRIYGSLGAPLRALGARPVGPPYCRYVEWQDDVCTLEGGIPLDKSVAPEPPFAAATIGGRCVFTVHVGPYEGLGETYRAVERWIADNGHRSTGAPWDLYIDDPGEVPAETLRTEVYWPVA